MKSIKAKAVGMSGKRLKRVGQTLQRHIDSGKLAGSIVLLAREGEVVYHKCQGHMDVDANIPMHPEALFRIFSMSKPITSVAILTLYEQGCFHLTDPVSRFIPEFANVKVFAGEGDDGLITEDLTTPITIHHLLTHTSGLCYGIGASEPNPVDDLYQAQQMMRTNESMADKIKRLVQLPLLFQPGTKWHYSVATDVLGYLVELVSGMDFDAYLKQTIFEPLGMVDTDFYVPADQRNRLAKCYTWDENQKILDMAAIMPHPEEQAWLTMAARPAFLSGGGGLVSSTDDYLNFALMLRNRGELYGERILSSKTVEFMTMNHLTGQQHTWEAPHYGFGLGVGVDLSVAQSKALGSAGTYGWGGAASTDYFYDPQEDLIGILMVQLMQANPNTLRQDYRLAAYQSIVD